MEQTIALEAATDPDHVAEDYMGLMNTNATSVESLASSLYRERSAT